MADAINNDAIMKRFLYREKISFEEYGKITVDTRTNVFAKSYATSLENTFKGLSDAKIRMFRGGLNKKVLDKSEEIKAECESLVKADKGLEALGLMYGALKYDSADQGFKDMVDKIEKKAKPREDKAEKTPKGEGAKDPKKEGDASEATKKPDEKKEPAAPGAPAEDKGAKGVGPAAAAKPADERDEFTAVETISLAGGKELDAKGEFDRLFTSVNKPGLITIEGDGIKLNLKWPKTYKKIDVKKGVGYTKVTTERTINKYMHNGDFTEFEVTYTVTQQKYKQHKFLLFFNSYKADGEITSLGEKKLIIRQYANESDKIYVKEG